MVALPVFATARAAFGLYEAASLTGVVGWPDVASALVKFLPALYKKVHKADTDALDEMVEIARSLVPQDTGRLLAGITGETDEDAGLCIFQASAVRQAANGKAGADYARFVEFGTHHGTRGVRQPVVADEAFFDPDNAYVASPLRGRVRFRTRRAYRTSSGTPPQPFFFPAADQVLQKRGVQMDAVTDALAREQGWQ